MAWTVVTMWVWGSGKVPCPTCHSLCPLPTRHLWASFWLSLCADAGMIQLLSSEPSQGCNTPRKGCDQE
jgi:hypothetical protein